MYGSVVTQLANYGGFFGTNGEENDINKYRHKLLNELVTFGSNVTCQWDLRCDRFFTNSMYGGFFGTTGEENDNKIQT